MALAYGVGGTPVVAAPSSSTQPAVAQPWTSIAAGFGVAVVAYAAGLALHGLAPSSYRISSQWSAFAGMFVLALAIERALEPFTRYLGPDTADLEHRRNEALADADASGTASAQADLQRGRELTAIVVWGTATALGFLLASVLDVTLLEAIRAEGSGQPPFWADLLVTGLVVGAGTKPLHDLVTNLQKSKDDKHDPPAVRGAG